MSKQYDAYLAEHRYNVSVAVTFLQACVPEIMKEISNTEVVLIAKMHDASKNDPREYAAYDMYFYGGKKTPEVQVAFNRAWLRHIHENPHHWQHWILRNDDGSTIALEMPLRYIIEMICDWMSFAIGKGDLHELFNWYKENSTKMTLGVETRETVQYILGKIRERCVETGGKEDNHCGNDGLGESGN